ncbi:MAG TPA: peptidoglycan-binding protein LysM [Sulfuricaulis sp.]|nr:peptidoglycan-binding protein LysM [Sulfuricaulis sp.]
MGLFDFAAELGKKLFDRSDEGADKIKQHIEKEGVKIEGLNVSLKDGVVNLAGKADSADTKEKAILLAGNVQGVTQVVADNLQAPPQQAKVDYYVIKSGDTLSGLAKKYYGNAKEYPRLFEANREVIKDPNLIYVGQKIRIPL